MSVLSAPHMAATRHAPRASGWPAQVRLLAPSDGAPAADTWPRDIEIVAATATPVRRFDWDGAYDEVLTISPEAVDLSRLEATGVPLLDSHNQWALASNLGAVTSARFEDGALICTARFADSPWPRDIAARIADRTLRAASIGYQVLAAEADDPGPDGVRTVRITSWTLLELSLVSVPADPASGTRSAQAAAPIRHPAAGIQPALRN